MLVLSCLDLSFFVMFWFLFLCRVQGRKKESQRKRERERSDRAKESFQGHRVYRIVDKNQGENDERWVAIMIRSVLFFVQRPELFPLLQSWQETRAELVPLFFALVTGKNLTDELCLLTWYFFVQCTSGTMNFLLKEHQMSKNKSRKADFQRSNVSC